MSRVKNPREKKRLRLDRDRRNVFGENDKASRKNIPRNKRRSRMRLRHAASQALAKVRGEVDESVAMEAEALTRSRTIVLQRKAFRKRPDEPLRTVIEWQRNGRLQKRIQQALKQAGILAGSDHIGVGTLRFGVDRRDLKRASGIIRKVLKANADS